MTENNLDSAKSVPAGIEFTLSNYKPKIRDSKKRSDLDSIFHDIWRNEAPNIDKDTVQILSSKLIDSNVITVKKTKDQKSLFLTKDATEILTEDNTVYIISNDESQDGTPVDPNDIDLSVTSTKPKDSGNTKPNPASNRNYVSLELFNTFYDDYIEYKHYVNDDVIQNISFNKELGKSVENETKSRQSKIKLLQQEIQTLKNENKDLKEENKSHLKIIELLSIGHDSDIPLRNYGNYNPVQTCITNQHHSISSDSSTWNFPKTVSRPRPIDPKPNILTSAISQNRFAPLSIELESTWENNDSDNQSNHDCGANNYTKKSLIISFNAQMQMP